MIVPLRRSDATSANPPPRAAAVIADPAQHDSIGERDDSGRKLRNRILLANLIAWIVIAIAIRLIF
jgi:hypothetical protein